MSYEDHDFTMDYEEQMLGSRSNTKYPRKLKYGMGKNDPHIPNQEESKLLRRIMSETGMKEEEVRNIKKYRKLLSDAAKSSETSNERGYDRIAKRLMKTVTKELKLAKEHPLCKEAFNRKAKERKDSWGFSFRYWYISPIQLTKADRAFLRKLRGQEDI